MKTAITTKLAPIAIAVIIALVPFHALLTVWGSTFIGHYTALRVWEDVLILLLLAAAAWVLYRDRVLWHEVKRLWLFRLIAAYVALHILLGGIAYFYHQVNIIALSYALVVNLQFPLLFFLAWVFAAKNPRLREHVGRLILIPAAVVVCFGLLQTFVLPTNILQHVGYSPATIRPYETVDQNMQFVRVQSTLRGANPLGAYLVIVGAVLAALGVQSIWRKRRIDHKGWGVLMFGVATVIVLYFTYSRSAYLGTALAVFGVGWLSIPNKQVRRWLLVSAVTLCVMAGSTIIALRHNSHIEDTFFHSSQLSHSAQSSNQKRATALEMGVHDVLYEPIGRGPGTAGPASVHNNHPARIAENYYLQIGQEVGWLGLFLFLSINVIVAWQLWERRDGWPALALLASLLGISLINMLSHAWADVTLALVWWGLAGIVLAPQPKQKK